MAVNREQLVLVGTVAVLGLLSWRTFGSTVTTASTKRAAEKSLDARPTPDARLALPTARTAGSGRDVLSPPSDTRPLPPLELQPPPIDSLSALFPPPLPGPSSALLGRALRTKPGKVDAPDLFAGQTTADDELESAPASAPTTVRPAPLVNADELASRVAQGKKLYDWVRTGDFRFGLIANKERWTLRDRPNEDILFMEYDVNAGRPRFPGQPPIPVPRKNVGEYGFADTVINGIEQRRATFGDPLPTGQYDEALLFAESCLALRHETPRALEVAAEMYRRAAAVIAQDPAPKLGLARVLEAGFRFEEAHDLYQSLLAGPMPRNPLVLASLGELEARFLLDEPAEQHLRDAETYGRTQWVAQSALGRFLLQRGRAVEALPHLQAAVQYEPSEPERKSVRARLRADLGDAYLSLAQVTEAMEAYRQALAADAEAARASAGLGACALLGGKLASGEGASSTGFESQLVAGLTALKSVAASGSAGATAARDALLAAATADPLRAHAAWRALSWLAETAGNAEEAQRFIDLAYEAMPSDFWTLYQRGRLAMQRDDLDGALESFRAALDLEVGSSDVLVQLGALMFRRGELEAAERYLARAVQLDPQWSEASTLRGLVYLERGALSDAETSFRTVLATNPDDPTARNGMAWCFYRRGDATEALARLRELDDNRRALPETDPHRVWARGQMERITDHLEKVVWTDSFDRRQLMNGWETQENAGPLVSIHDGVVSITGQFKQDGKSRVWQRRSASDFVSIEAKITVQQGTNARVGLFVARESSRQGEAQVEAEVVVARHNEPGKNAVQTRVVKQRGEENGPFTDVQGFDWPVGKPVVVRIERVGDASSTKVNILFDGIPVLSGRPLPALGRTNNELKLGVYVEGQTGRTATIDIDDVDIVFRKR
jgi:tetratricopeptide (TPR) repeat protein